MGDRRNGNRLEGEVSKERGFLNVGALAVPSVGLAGGAGNFVPGGILFGKIAIKPAKDFGLQCGFHSLRDFLVAGPEVAEVNGFAVAIDSKRFLREIDIDSAGEGKGDHEGWRHKEVGFNGGVDACLKVAVTRKDTGGDEIMVEDRFLDRSGKRAGVADAGGTAVADEIEAELIEVRLKACGVEVVGDNAGTWSEGCFDGGGDRESAFDCFFGEKTCGKHDGGVGGIGAGGNGGDDDGAVMERG